MKQVTIETDTELNCYGLNYAVATRETGEIIAAFVEKEDAELFCQEVLNAEWEYESD